MKNIQIVALFLLSLFAACQKDDQPLVDTTDTTDTTDMQVPVTKHLVDITYQNLPNEWTRLKYDTKGRVILMETDEDTYTVKYLGNTVQISEFRKEENRVVWDFTGKLNAKGNVTEGSGSSSYTGTVYQEKYTFKYDTDGNLTQKTLDRNNGAQVYVYDYFHKNGNLDRFDCYWNGKLDYSGAYEYYTDREDKSKINWEQLGVANTFTGNRNKNLMSKYTGYRDGKESWHVTFTYEFDAEGYPVSGRSDYSSGKFYLLSYKYE